MPSFVESGSKNVPVCLSESLVLLATPRSLPPIAPLPMFEMISSNDVNPDPLSALRSLTRKLVIRLSSALGLPCTNLGLAKESRTISAIASSIRETSESLSFS